MAKARNVDYKLSDYFHHNVIETTGATLLILVYSVVPGYIGDHYAVTDLGPVHSSAYWRNQHKRDHVRAGCETTPQAWQFRTGKDSQRARHYKFTRRSLTIFNKIAIQGTPQMAVD